MLNVLSLFSGIGAIFRQFNFEKVSAVDCKYENEKANR